MRTLRTCRFAACICKVSHPFICRRHSFCAGGLLLLGKHQSIIRTTQSLLPAGGSKPSPSSRKRFIPPPPTNGSKASLCFPKALLNFLLRVLYEPVVFHLIQTVQNRTKRLEKPQIKISARAHIEPDADKRVHCEPSAGKAWLERHFLNPLYSIPHRRFKSVPSAREKAR